MDPKQYYTHLNRSGRYLLREDGQQQQPSSSSYYDQQRQQEYNNNGGGVENQFDHHQHHHDDEDNNTTSNNKGRVPLALWPIVLGRVNEQHWSTQQSASVLYTLLKEGPAIIASR